MMQAHLPEGCAILDQSIAGGCEPGAKINQGFGATVAPETRKPPLENNSEVRMAASLSVHKVEKLLYNNNNVASSYG